MVIFWVFKGTMILSYTGEQNLISFLDLGKFISLNHFDEYN